MFIRDPEDSESGGDGPSFAKSWDVLVITVL